MKMGRPITISITGPDGCGKSVLCQKLVNHFEKEGLSISVCSPWNSLEGLSDTFDSAYIKNRQGVQKYLEKTGHGSRLLFMYHALMKSWEDCMNKGSDILLADGYWFKYAIAQMSLGQTESEVLTMSSIFPRCDRNYYLNLPLETILRRKKTFSNYEAGMQGKSHFTSFQMKMNKFWKKYFDMWNLENIANDQYCIGKISKEIGILCKDSSDG